MFVYHIVPPEYAEGGLRGSHSKYAILSVLGYVTFHFVLFYEYVVVAERRVVRWYSYKTR